MNLLDYSMYKCNDFNTTIKSEEDLKIKIILPYLKELGYEPSEMCFEETIDVVIGSKKTKVYSDIAIKINNKIELIIDVKKPTHIINQTDILQASSYAKLIDTPPATMSCVTNGRSAVTKNTFTGEEENQIPSKSQLMKRINATKIRCFTEIQLNEVRSILFTLAEPEELYKLISNSKNVIEKKALIRSDQSFKEITKIILVKMNEENRVKYGIGENRFSKKYLETFAAANKISIVASFIRLFNDATERYPNIYQDDNIEFLIKDDEAILKVVDDLSPFSFLGTGEDIKGAVYEIFLKGTLRGEFDQYFTPREIVEFIVKVADPKIDDKFLDPACGSGGFLIQAFNHVNKKINNLNCSEVERNRISKELVDYKIWGHEADADLHVLAKINMIMHGDGWNHILQGDSLISNNLKDNDFDLVLANPPFTIKYDFADVLSKYELGIGKQSEELDILFVEKSLKVLKENGELYIVLPEGLLTNKSYQYFREWLLEKADVLCCISLPEGAFIPMGSSVSKTCIIGLRKKGINNYVAPTHAFLGVAKEIGFEIGKKIYKKIPQNDLNEFLLAYDEIFEEIRTTSNGGEFGWVPTSRITAKRLGASHLLNLIDYKDIDNTIQLSDIITIDQPRTAISDYDYFYYLEIPDISETTGAITNIRKIKGSEISSNNLVEFKKGNILFSRINPRKNRVTYVPNFKHENENVKGVTSGEIYILNIIPNNGFIPEEYYPALVPILRSETVKKQIVRLGVGSSSSRARVYDEDLECIRIPKLTNEILKRLSHMTISNSEKIWSESQKYFKNYIKMQNLLNETDDKNYFRTL